MMPLLFITVVYPFMFSVFTIYLTLSSLVMLHPWLFLHALAINSFLFLCLHHDSVSVQLNLASPCMRNRPRVAGTQLKIGFQVKDRVFPRPALLSLHLRAADSSPHSWIFMEKFLFEADAVVKIDHRSKYGPRLSLAAILVQFSPFLYRSAEFIASEWTKRLDLLMMLDYLPFTTKIMYFCINM